MSLNERMTCLVSNVTSERINASLIFVFSISRQGNCFSSQSLHKNDQRKFSINALRRTNGPDSPPLIIFKVDR